MRRWWLQYCIHTWGLSGGKELKGIEILQKKAMRYIENTHSRAHTNVLFYKYKTLMVKDLIDYNICNFMQKCTHNTAPSSFQNLFIKNRNFDRSLSYNLKLVRKTSLRLFPTLVFPRVWNALTREGGVWRVIIPVLQVKGKNSCVQLFLPFFWRANREFYKQKKRTQSLAFNIHYLQLSDHNYGGAAATGHKRRLKRGWPRVYALDIEWSLMNKLSLFLPNSPP